jgi:hypothetical protein
MMVATTLSATPSVVAKIIIIIMLIITMNMMKIIVNKIISINIIKTVKQITKLKERIAIIKGKILIKN